MLFRQMRAEEREKMELWAMAQEESIQNTNLSNLTFEVLQQTGGNPMIQVNESDQILQFRNIDWNAEESDSIVLNQILEKIKKENPPILIQYRNDAGELLINQKLYYGNSELLKKLQYYPLALLLIIFLFGAVVYFVFKTAQIAEQNRLWAAMAKETAHQIGTPLTSILGWLTLLKEKDPEAMALLEIEKDVDRLKVISERFSKVGSLPELNDQDLIRVVLQTVSYLQKRTSSKVEFTTSWPTKPIVLKLNEQLLSWTLENLIKNGIDAMKGKGKLGVSIGLKGDQAEILVSDTGAGISRENSSKIFNPGFSTKKRGWGLGLSLAKRIVVDYHKGKIGIKKTVLGKGTEIQILLPKK
ncbi:MAG: two-component sensor histidine kinase [Flavobacteriales bacterium MED-G22]|nr:MAG: two-component sensor histidine kinase [Flavobacteriales bacterium MED-G22]